MRFIFALLLLCSPMVLAGCAGDSKPDPRERENFVDTSDPTMIAEPAAADGGSGEAKE